MTADKWQLQGVPLDQTRLLAQVLALKLRAGDVVALQGDLGAGNDIERRSSVENHYKWVNAARIMGCHSIRVNAFGEEDETSFRTAIVDGMGRLAEYAAKEEINVIIENHGLHSSNGT